MSIDYRTDCAVFSEVVAVDEAEGLLEWLQSNASAHADLSACTHMHPANLQVLMAGRVSISAWPSDTRLAAWLMSVLVERKA
jgi:hypothetical protein